MIHYILDADFPTQRLPFYLAMEEWVAQYGDSRRDGFFTWQVEPTVIFGRNQQIDTEVNLDYCRSHGINYYRRKSGGGCVFADMSNIMISYITHSRDSISEIFARYTTLIANRLREIGLDARASGRNDITIGGRKLSGNAFYRTPEGASIAHGTMLYGTDVIHMANAITPSRSKLESKKVKSVPAHITTVSEHSTLDLATFKQRLEEGMCDATYRLTPDDIAAVREIERQYYRPEWIMGRNHKASLRRHRRVEGAGELDIAIELDAEGRIAYINLAGDFFLTGDLDRTIISNLKNIKFTREDVASALSGINVSDIISGLSNEQLVNTLF